MKWLIGVLTAAAATTLALAARAATKPGPQPGTGRVYVRSRVLYGPGGVSMPITSNDLLWLGRAIVGETGGSNRRSAAAVSWALAQNLMLIIGSGGARPRMSSFTSVVRAYCQPVNPAWATAGSGKCLQRPEACTPRHIERRRQMSTMTWDALPPTTRQAVEDFASGRLENPVPGMVDWAAYRYEGSQVDIGGNWFGVGARRRLV